VRTTTGPRRYALVAIALVVPVLGQRLVREIPVVHRAELLIYDWHSRALPAIPLDPRLVVIGMDDESLNRLPLERPAYPLPRTIHAKLVQELHAAGARVIGFDVWFSKPIPSEDALFAEALAASGPVLTAVEPRVDLVGGEEVTTLLPPAPALRGSTGLCSILALPLFGRVRWLMPYVIDHDSNQRYPHLSVALAESLGADVSRAPRGGDGEILVRFAGPAGAIEPIPYHEIFSGSWRQSRGPDFFRGKAVIVGIVGRLVDRTVTPLGEMQGVEVLAQAASAMLQGQWIRHWTEIQNFALEFALCLGLVAAIWTVGLRQAFAVFLLEGGAWILGAHWLFIKSQVWADTLEPILGLLATLLVASAYEIARVRRVFHRFMPAGVADRMLESHPGDAAAAHEEEVTVVFCDVRDSTRLAEALPSRDVEELMRRYFTAGEEAAHRLGAELDKFVGDEIMLYFEDRRGLEPHAVRAIRWALALQEACRAITATGLAGDIGFRVGVGMCTGLVRIGTVGAKHRIQHTVMGDAVNTAARIQALTKELNEPILFGEPTWDKVRAFVDAESIGEVPIRGKEHPMRLHKPVRIR
jgi:adenylate cyclase